MRGSSRVAMYAAALCAMGAGLGADCGPVLAASRGGYLNRPSGNGVRMCDAITYAPNVKPICGNVDKCGQAYFNSAGRRVLRSERRATWRASMSNA